MAKVYDGYVNSAWMSDYITHRILRMQLRIHALIYASVVKFGLDITRIPLRTDGRWEAYL